MWFSYYKGAFSVSGGFTVRTLAPLQMRAGAVKGSWPDVVFLGPDTLYISRHIENGYLDGLVTFPGPAGVTMGALQIADMNGDGLSDVIAASVGNSPTAQYWVFPQKQQPAGDDDSLLTPWALPGYGSPEALASADLDRNGYDDLVAAHGGLGIGRIMQDSAGHAPEALSNVPDTSHYGYDSLATSDLNGDGCTDAVLGDGSRGVILLPGLNCREPWSMSNRYDGDFDGDGSADILWHNGATGASTIWRSGNSATRIAMTRVTDTKWRIAGIGDFNGDGRSDVVWRHAMTGAGAIWFSASARANLKTVSDLSWQMVGIGDFAHDGKSDILWRHKYTGAVALWRDGLYEKRRNLTTLADRDWIVVGAGDFDGDGLADILWRHRGDGRNMIWRGGNSATLRTVSKLTDFGWQVAGLGDFDHDGSADILWHHSFDGRTMQWPAGAATRSQPLTRVSDLSWKIAGVGDYDRDGHSDILWRRSSTGENVVWRAAASGNTQPVTGITNMQWMVTR